MLRLLVLIALCFASVAHAAPQKIGEGVWVIEHPLATPDWPEGNTVIFEGTRGLLVVDACYLPSTARADLAAIRKLSKKPVRYLVNTHWHYDHGNGNREYVKAFPGVDIVAHAETARLTALNSERYARGVTAEGSPARKKLAEEKDPAAIAARKKELAELKDLKVALPTLTFESELRVDLGGRTLRILHLGRGNTPGDTLVFDEEAGILAMGDLVVAPVPYAWNSYPSAWIATLERMRGLNAKILVPGHGPVMRDDRYVVSVIELLRFVVGEVTRLAVAGKTQDEVRAGIDLGRFRKAMASTPDDLETFDDSIGRALIERAFQETRGGLF